MELSPHDLVRVYNPDHLQTEHPLPAWAVSAMLNAPYVVVRRAMERPGLVPVGVRGSKRAERLAAWLPASKVSKVISPQELVSPRRWTINQNELKDPLISLQRVTKLLNGKGLNWGPTGSTAFELVTGVKMLRDGSDLDLVIKLNSFLSVSNASSLLDSLNAVTLVRLDVQLDTPIGGVSLAEYISSATVLVKSAYGPLIVPKDAIWNPAENLAISEFQL